MIGMLKGSWSFLLHHWIGSGISLAVAVGIVVLFALNPIAAAKLASAASGLVQDRARAAIQWARKDHDWWRIGCFTMALLFGLASFTAYDQHRTVLVVITQAKVDKDNFARLIAEKDTALADFQAQQDVFADAARKEAANLKAAQDQSATALAQVVAMKAQAARSNTAWWSGYAKRPDSCRAAQEALDVACNSVGDY